MQDLEIKDRIRTFQPTTDYCADILLTRRSSAVWEIGVGIISSTATEEAFDIRRVAKCK